MAEIPTRKFEFSAVHHMLGLELQERSSSHAVITMEPRPEFLQEEGVVQGGILTALADAAAVYVTLPDLPAERTMTSIEFKLNFLRPALLESGTLTARSKLIKGGRTITLVKSTVTQGDREIATGLFTYMLMDR
ncbi:MAG: hypothetical protein ACI8QS_001233 [Planctomycetota bacterium]|jgi:uncharacterized protein (TIGR00369 family)